MYKKYDKNILPNDIFLKKNYPDSTSSPGKFNKKGPLTSSITPITIARATALLSFFAQFRLQQIKNHEVNEHFPKII